MRILFLGNFKSEFSSENYYLKTFREMGHEVVPVNEPASPDQLLIPANIDMFFWVHTTGWNTPGIDVILSEMRKKGVPVVAYHLDVFMGLERWGRFRDGHYAKVDHFFTVDLKMAEYLNEHTKTKGHFLPAGVYEGECVVGTENKEKYPHEIIFTGAKSYHHEWPYRPKLINWLQETYGDKFAHYGNGGGLPVIRGLELNNLYASSKIVIGDTLCKDFNYPAYTSDRLFECLGRNSFLIYPRIQGLEFFYQDKREVVYYDFNNFDQLKSLIDYYLVNDSERNAIREAGFRRTKEAHTYRHRLTQILQTIFGINNAKPYEGPPYDCPPLNPVNDETKFR